MKRFNIAVLSGDGIGPEVMDVTLALLNEVSSKFEGIDFNYHKLEAGAVLFQKTGEALPEKTFKAAKDADAILLGAMGEPGIRYPDGREITPQIDLRERLGLFAGLRPIRAIPGLPPVLSDPRASAIDFVIVRESTEGLFSSRNSNTNNGDDVARDTLMITRSACNRLFEFSFNLATNRKQRGHSGRLTCVDKANVLSSYAFFRKVFGEYAVKYPEIDADYNYVDALAHNLIKQPWDYDVLVTENMFGDIISDLAAALIGGMGMAPSADIGENNAVFQPCHGTAPDIVGTGKANPIAMMLSAAMMLDWLGEKQTVPELIDGSILIQKSIDKAFAKGNLLPYEFGGEAGTQEIFNSVVKQL